MNFAKIAIHTVYPDKKRLRMPNSAPKTCQHPNCQAYALPRSIYCGQHQTEDSLANRNARRYPITRRGKRKPRQPSALWFVSDDAAGLKAAFESGDNNFDDVKILGK